MRIGCLKIKDSEPVYTISVASRLVKIPVWTLRQLDKKGVVTPKKTKGNTRLYSNCDLNKLHRIKHLIEKEHVNINGIKIILKLAGGEDNGENAKGVLKLTLPKKHTAMAKAKQIEIK